MIPIFRFPSYPASRRRLSRAGAKPLFMFRRPSKNAGTGVRIGFRHELRVTPRSRQLPALTGKVADALARRIAPPLFLSLSLPL